MAVGVTARAISTILATLGALVCHLLRPRHKPTGLYPRNWRHDQ